MLSSLNEITGPVASVLKREGRGRSWEEEEKDMEKDLVACLNLLTAPLNITVAGGRSQQLVESLLKI